MDDDEELDSARRDGSCALRTLRTGGLDWVAGDPEIALLA